MTLKVASANWYFRNTRPQLDAHFLASKGVQVMGIQEGHGGNAEDIKHALQAYHVWWGTPNDKEKAYAAKDVPVAIRKTFNVHAFWFRQISARAQKKDIGMPRAATVVRFTHEGHTYSFINTHTNAAVQGHNPKVLHLSQRIKRVYEYIQGMIVLEQMIKNARKRGDKVIVTGDLNYRVTGKGIWRYSPAGLFKRTGLLFRNSGLDYVAYDKSQRCTHFEVVPRSRTGSDHEWLILTLN